MSDSSDNGGDVVGQRVAAVSDEVESRLAGSLTDGKIDMNQLRGDDEALSEVLDAFAQSKTTRDDPKVTASDVAKLLEAQSRTTPLGIALARLRDSLED